MAIRTRSMRRPRSDAELYVPQKELAASPAMMTATLKQRSRPPRTRHEPAIARVEQRIPRTPSNQPRRSKRLPSTPTTTCSPSANRPNRPARPQLTTSQSVPIVLDARQSNVHTTRFLPESKVAHLKSWLEAQTTAAALLDPKTPVRRPDMSKWLQQRRSTRAHDAPARTDWRREIDEMSVAPATPSRGLVRKLEAAFESPQQQQKSRPP